MKRNKNILLTLIATVVLMYGCDKDTYSLKGKLDNSEQCTLYLMEMDNENVNMIDTIDVSSNGKFHAKEKLSEESIFILQGPNDYIMLCPKKGEKIVLSGDCNNLATTYTVQGSEQSSKLKILSDEQTKTRFSLKMLNDQLSQMDIDNIDSVQREVAKIYKTMRKEQKEFLINYINANEGSLTTLVALYRNMEGRPLISFEHNADVYKKVLNGLKKTHPNNKNTKNLQQFIDRLEQVQQNNQPAK